MIALLALALASGDPIPADTFVARRARLAEILPERAIALVPSAPYNRPDESFRQDASFWYFTGLEIPNAVLWVEKREGERIERLFVPSRDDRFDVERLGVAPRWIFADDALRARAGIETFDFVEDLGRVVVRAIVEGGRVFAVREPRHETRAGDEFAPRSRPEAFVEALERYAGRDRVEDLGRFVARLRQVKDPDEIARMRDAARITVAALAVAPVEPGATEASVAGALDAALRRLGASRLFFAASVRSGPNALRPRSIESASYDRGNRTMKQGEVVVLEAGAEVGMYGCVLARTLPVGEPYPAEARRALDALCGVVDAVVAAAKPGKTLADLETLAREKCPEEWRPMFESGIGPFVGLEPDDPADPTRLLEPGMVFVVAPRIVDGDRGVAVALADTVLVTDGGGSLLTGGGPR